MKMMKILRRALPFFMVFAALCVLEPAVEAGHSAAGYGQRSTGSSAVYALAGEFRAVLANLLWIKVEKYHHEFMRTNPDWRSDAEILPLIRIITDLDPTFVEAYLCGGWMLSMGLDREKEGLEFLKQGLRNNPDSLALNEIIGTVYARKLKQPRLALRYLYRAYELSPDDWDRRRLRRLINTVKAMSLDSPRSNESRRSTAGTPHS